MKKPLILLSWITLTTAFGIILSGSNSSAASSNCNMETRICMMTRKASTSDTREKGSPQSSTAREAMIGGDLSETGEEEYVSQIHDWLLSLPKAKADKARSILHEAHPELKLLRKAIYNKKIELAAVRFDEPSSLERLPKLGMDLQKLRGILRKKLENINSRLLNEAGIKMNELGEEAFWLQPLARNPGKQSLHINLDDNISYSLSFLTGGNVLAQMQ